MFPLQTAPLCTGAFHLRYWLCLDAQRALVDECRALLDGPTPGYVPTLRSGAKMRLRMLCLGRHWNPKTYRYEPTGSDYDGLPAPPLPDHWKKLARGIAAASYASSPFDPRVPDMYIDPDVCIINAYEKGGRLGLHQDKDESAKSLAAGIPVVSISLGDTAHFAFGGTRKEDPSTAIDLKSGDAFVFGGPARLCYHGVSRVLPGTAPPGLELAGRINLTFRQYDVGPPQVTVASVLELHERGERLNSIELRMEAYELARGLSTYDHFQVLNKLAEDCDWRDLRVFARGAEETLAELHRTMRHEGQATVKVRRYARPNTRPQRRNPIRPDQLARLRAAWTRKG